MTRFHQWVNLRHFRLVTAIAEHGSILRAANVLNLSQPTASKLLQDMEEELKAPLFIRNNRGVEPTKLGAEFVRHGRTILAQIRQTTQALESQVEGSGGHVVLGTLLTASSSLLPRTLAALHRKRPNIHLRVVEGTNDHLMPRLISGELDFVIGRLTNYRYRNDVEQEPLSSDATCIVARVGHPLAQEGHVPLADLLNADWILPPAETTLRRQFEAVFHRQGLRAPSPAIESVSFLVNRSLLLETDMLGVWPRSLIDTELDGHRFTILETEVTVEVGTIGISRRRESLMSPAAEAVMSELRLTAGNAHTPA